MSLVYKNEFINDADGVPHAVLDVQNCDFSNDPSATFGMKTAPTFAFRAKAGQKIVTSQGGNVEASFECKGGEIVFVNRLPNGQMDIYVPRDGAGNSTGEQILKTGYTLLSGDLDRGALFRPSAAPSKILFEAIKEPTVIVDAFGPGNHQFLGEGATLKIAGTSVTGINQAAFDVTWALTDENGVVTRPARPPEPNFYSIERFQQIFAR